MIPKFINRELVPHKPGVYIYKNSKSRVIYVGKAIDLYHRVASYFRTYNPGLKVQNQSGIGSVKTEVLVREIAGIETIIVESELEALILEANLIKKYLPEFNVRLVDDKDYLYIKITNEDFPRALTARKHDLKDSLKYFGPFPSSRTVKETLKSLRKVFPWCSQPPRRPLAKLKACFHFHLEQCPGVCIGRISKEDYRKNIFRLAKLLDGQKENLIDELSKDMEKASKNQDFEEAGRLKKMIDGISYLTQPNRTKNYLENPNFLEDQREVALKALQDALGLPKIPSRIEGYDISNIQGKEATGSLVVLTNGEIDKSQYRKFKIHPPAGGLARPNDVGMHREMMKRRLRHKEWPMPDLIIIDGGRGQVNGVSLEIRNSKLEIRIYGLAKRLEWLYPPGTGEIVKLSRKSPALQLLQRLRDESHRFAITYHRKLRNKATFL